MDVTYLIVTKFDELTGFRWPQGLSLGRPLMRESLLVITLISFPIHQAEKERQAHLASEFSI